MAFKTLTTAIATTVTLSVLGFTATSARAGTFHQGWNYAVDSFNDGVESGSIVGEDSGYEFYSIAIQDTADKVSVAINSNAPLGGWEHQNATNNNIAFGDLFFNFGDENLESSQGSLYGIHFDTNGDNGLELGVYENVVGTSIGGSNSGFTSLETHATRVSENGGSANLGDFAYNDPYFNDKPVNSIASGTKIGEIELLEEGDLDGIDFGHFGATGDYTFGFSFDRSLLPSGDFIAHLFYECLNDGIALAGNLEAPPVVPPVATPEPGSMLALALLGSAFALKRRFN
ncbi:XDD3 family exosortase-dependent surface protein [Roseofilum casamattae]|uniref:PEP-CTERM sorting domain-containing protein n=1 Tax=Roseofilum casamattae BLCC-M143 TaxID=3022442 RepID=A0ABT7C0H3_9CYAN|nr:XDD3 family exosortase-dependent surface protein [Roseofilum casamattae]MDJ1184952.1 PEP-CTERM sorting domain-containing protein [Roseofilum casamattae BLCC-M143]